MFSKPAFFFSLFVPSIFFPLTAQTAWRGVQDNDWFISDNWDNGVPTATTDVDIISRINSAPRIQPGESAAASSLDVLGIQLSVAGVLDVGGDVLVNGLSSDASLFVEGQNARLEAEDFSFGNFTPAPNDTTVRLSGGGTLSLTGNLEIHDSNDPFRVQGGVIEMVEGKRLTVSGFDGLAELEITNGGVVTTDRLRVGAAFNDPESGSVVVSGAGSLLDADSMSVGIPSSRASGAGTITVTDGGKVAGTMTLGPSFLGDAGGRGTLLIGDGGAPGYVEGIVFGSAGPPNCQVVVNHDATNYFLTGDGTSQGNPAILQANVILTVRGSGVTAIVGENIHRETIVETGATLRVEDGGTALSNGSELLFLKLNGGDIEYQRSDDVTVINRISGTGSLTQIGPGTLTLTAASSYSGGTTVVDGALMISQSGAGVGPVQVGSGASFGGNGSAPGVVTLNDNASLLPGLGLGTIQLGGLVLNNGAVADFELGAPGGSNDLCAVTGDAVLAGGLRVTGLPGFGAGSYTLFTYGGTLNAQDLQIEVMPEGFEGSLDDSTPGEVRLVVSSSTTSFEAWAADNGLAGSDALPGASPFGDLPNLLKFAFGLDGDRYDRRMLVPGNGIVGLPVMTSDTGAGITFEYIRRIDAGIGYQVLQSRSLFDFTAVTRPEQVDPIDAEWERVRIPGPFYETPASTVFLQVEVTENP